MKGGDTQVMRMLRKRCAGGEVIGLYAVFGRELHEFHCCTIAGQQKSLLTVGRAPRCDIRLHEPTVSLVHCDIRLNSDGTYTIVDADSTNGLFVNDLKVERAVLAPGMWVFIGRAELVAVGPDKRIPITAKTYSSFLGKAALTYGSDRKASEYIRKSAATIGRARRRWNGRGEAPGPRAGAGLGPDDPQEREE